MKPAEDLRETVGVRCLPPTPTYHHPDFGGNSSPLPLATAIPGGLATAATEESMWKGILGTGHPQLL